MRSVQDSVLPRVQGSEPLLEGCGGEVSPHISSFLFAAPTVAKPLTCDSVALNHVPQVLLFIY